MHSLLTKFSGRFGRSLTLGVIVALSGTLVGCSGEANVDDGAQVEVDEAQREAQQEQIRKAMEANQAAGNGPAQGNAPGGAPGGAPPAPNQ